MIATITFFMLFLIQNPQDISFVFAYSETLINLRDEKSLHGREQLKKLRYPFRTGGKDT